MGYAWWVMGNFLKVCLPSGVLKALIMVDWRQDREKEEDEERKEAGGGQHLTGSVSFLTTESDMISGNKEKRIQYC